MMVDLQYVACSKEGKITLETDRLGPVYRLGCEIEGAEPEYEWGEEGVGCCVIPHIPCLPCMLV